MRHPSQQHLDMQNLDFSYDSDSDVSNQITNLAGGRNKGGGEKSVSSFKRLNDSKQNQSISSSSSSSNSQESGHIAIPKARPARRLSVVQNQEIVQELVRQFEMNTQVKMFLEQNKPELLQMMDEQKTTMEKQNKAKQKEQTLEIIKKNLVSNYSSKAGMQDNSLLKYNDSWYKLKGEKTNDKNIKKLQEFLRHEAVKLALQHDQWKRDIRELKFKKKEKYRNELRVMVTQRFEAKRKHLMDSQRVDKAFYDAQPPLEKVNTKCNKLKKWMRRQFRKIMKHSRLPKKFIISYRNPKKEQWDIFILLMAVQNSFMVPIDIAFAPEFTNHPLYNFFDSLVEIFFVIDIILQFITSFMNRMGAEVFDSRKIFKNYAFSGKFIIDLLPLFGSQLFVTKVNSKFKFFGMLKITRVNRLTTMIAKLNLPMDVKALFILAKLTLFLLLWFHSMACGWYMAIYTNKFEVDSEGESLKWVPPSDFLNYHSSKLLANPDKMSLSEKYFYSLYYAILMIGNNELAPRSAIEMFTGAFILLFSSMLNALIFSEMAIMLLNFQKKVTEYQIILDRSNHIMSTIGLPKGYQEDIRQFLQITQDTREHQWEFDLFLNQLTPSLKIKIQNQIFSSAIIKNPLVRAMLGIGEENLEKSAFSKTKDFIKEKYNFKKKLGLTRNVTFRIKKQDNEQDPKKQTTNLKRATTKQWHYKERMRKSVAGSVSDGASMYDSQFNQDESESESSCSESDTDELPDHVIENVGKGHQRIEGIMTRFINEVQFSGSERKEDFLRLLVSRMGTCLAMPEEYVVEQGDPSDGMYFVQKGDAAVNIIDQNGFLHQAIKLLRVGDHFGEISLMFRCNRTATVLSMNYNNFAFLSYNSWREIVNMYPGFLKLQKKFYRTYKDVKKTFLINLMSRIAKFQNWLPQRYVDDIIYRMKEKVLNEEAIVLKAGQRASSVIFVEYGEIKVVTHFEGHEFIIDYLYPGSVINLRSFFLEDLVAVDFICTKNTKILEFDKDIVDILIGEHVQFERKFMLIQNSILKKNKTYPLDYEQNLPEMKIPREISQIQFKQYLIRKNILKNVVFNIIIENRQRPKPSHIARKYLDMAEIPNKLKFFNQKVESLFKAKNPQDLMFDLKYDQIMKQFGRISRIQDIKQKLYDNLISKAQGLGKRRVTRERDKLRLDLIFSRKIREVKKQFNAEKALGLILEEKLIEEMDQEEEIIQEVKKQKTMIKNSEQYLRVLKTIKNIDLTKANDGKSSHQSSKFRSPRSRGGDKPPKKKLANTSLNLQELQTKNPDSMRKVCLMIDIQTDSLMNLGHDSFDKRFSMLNRIARESDKQYYDQVFESKNLHENEKIRQNIKKRIRFLRKNGWNLNQIKQEISEASDYAWSIDSDLERKQSPRKKQSSVVDAEEFEKLIQETYNQLNAKKLMQNKFESADLTKNDYVSPRRMSLLEEGSKRPIQRMIGIRRHSHISSKSRINSRKSSKMSTSRSGSQMQATNHEISELNLKV